MAATPEDAYEVISTLDRSVIGDIEKVAVGDEGATLYLGER